ncbi:putative ribonuclease H-like domain-containing protein, partial [Tanacetum coccineum]
MTTGGMDAWNSEKRMGAELKEGGPLKSHSQIRHRREQLSDASIEIKAYSQGLKKVEAQLVAHQQGQLWYEQKIKFMKIDLDDKHEVPNIYNKKLLAEAQKEKEDLKAKKAELNNGWNKKSSQRELRETWNNVQRVNKQNQFVPSAVLTRTGKILVSTARASGTKNVSLARQSFNRQTVLTSTAMKFNTVKPMVNRVRPAHVFHNTHSPSSRPFKRTTVLSKKNSNQKVNTAKVNAVITVGGKRETAVKPSAGCNWRPQRLNWHNVSKYNGGSSLRNCYTFKDPLGRLKPKQAWAHDWKQGLLPSEFLDFNGGLLLLEVVKVTHWIQEDIIDAGDSEKEDESAQLLSVLPIWPSYSSIIHYDLKTDEKREVTVSTPAKASSTNLVNTVSIPVSTASPHEGLYLSDPTNPEQDDSKIPPLKDIYQNPTDGIFTNSSYDDEGAVANFTNLESVVNVSPIPTSRIYSIHPSTLILVDPKSAVQTRSKVTKSSGARAFKISEALKDESWVDAMQEELQQFKIQKVWILVDLPYGKKAIETKLVYRNKKDERGIVVRNKARLVAHGHRQDEGIDYDEVFAPMARIEAIRIFLAFASYMGFIVYQMDVKSVFFYGKIDEEVYVSQPPGFLDPKYPQKVYKVVKALYGLHQAPRACRFQMSSMGELTFFLGLQVKQKADGIFIVKDEEASDVDVHLYRSMIGSLMYLTASRPDIMFAVCACSRFQVTPKSSHLSAVKRIFRYLKGKPKLGLWYPRVSSFDLESYSDSDYAGANLDRKSTTGGCQFLGRRLISWQCKKQTIVATSTT